MKSNKAAPLLLMAAGFVVWSSAFVLLYITASVGCEFGWHSTTVGPLTLMRVILIAIFAAHLSVLIWLLVYCIRMLRQAREQNPSARFLYRAALGLTVASIAATIWVGMALLLPTACAAGTV